MVKQQRNTATAVEHEIERYVQYLTLEKGLARNTLESYRRDLEKYREYLHTVGIIDPRTIGKTHVRGFITALGQAATGTGKPLSARSIARIIVSVRGLHRFWHTEKITLTDPAVSVHPPRIGSRLPKAISVDHIASLLEVPDPGTTMGLRDRALLEFLYSTGARISEAINVDIDDLSLHSPTGTEHSGVVRLFGKGNKERIVPVGSFAVQALDNYLVRARPSIALHGRGTAALFLNARGSRITRQGAWLVLKKAAERAQLNTEISPHTLRHSYASHLLEGGADIRVVQELLGHSSVTTTQIYTKVTADTLREVFAATHPRALEDSSRAH